tara:strand:- start:188 stop:655 length:468 start_codon:yes stop_codon:yes gene_type:complete
MSFFFKYHKILYCLLFLNILTNCQLKKSTNSHGILFLENRVNKLVVKQSNKNDVINIIGQPHSKSIEDTNEWIYIERTFEKGKLYKLGKNILKTNNVLFLKFDKYGILENKKLFNKDDINRVAFSKKETENDLTKSSFVEGFLSSLRAKMYGNKR